MLKGHADIYLRDAITGEIVDERHEDNIVTNAVQDVLSVNPFGCRSDIYRFLPLATNLLGGVLLFPKTVPESTADYWAHGQWPTGYASNSSDTGGDPRRGNFNPNESYATSNGYRLVWDFGTADANGDISSICLTNSNGGVGFEISKYNRVPFAGAMAYQSSQQVDFQFKNESGVSTRPEAFHGNAFYSAVWVNDGSYKISSLKLLKWNANPNVQPFDRINVFENPTVISVDISEAHIGRLSYRETNYNTKFCWDENGMRIVTDNYNNGGYDVYYVTTIAWDGTVSEIAIQKGDMEGLRSVGSAASHAYGDWCYLQYYKSVNSGHEHGFYAIDLTNTSNIVQLVSSVPSEYSLTTQPGSDMFVQTSHSVPYCMQPITKNNVTYYWTMALDNGEIIFEEISTTTNSYFTTKDAFVFGHFGPYVIIGTYNSIYGMMSFRIALDNTYLATINNLATPITKTANRTLKIVYTLTEAS